MIPYGRQSLDEADIEAVVQVLKSDFLTQGPAVPAFEHALQAACGADGAVAVNSATSGLHLACLALGVGPGSRVWTVPNTFVASANCAALCGADVGFVDIDADTWNMDVTDLERRLVLAERAHELPDVVIPVHFAGEPCDMPRISALANRYGFSVIEDAAHAIGARGADARVGDCRYSDLCVFSFHPVKIITTAEGGAVTGRPELLATIAELRSHGITRETARFTGEPQGPWDYQQLALGLNYRMTDLQAALGESQLRRLEGFLERRHALADRYDQRFNDMPVRQQQRSGKNRSALHLYPVWLDPEQYDRRVAFEYMRASQIGVQVHYIPVHTQPYWRARGFGDGDFPVAERYYAGAMSLPMFPALRDDEQDQVVAALSSALDAALRG